MKWIILACLLIMLVTLPALAGKKECQTYLDKLQNIQSLQRQGHSLKSSNSLNKREAKARNKWWLCTQGKLATKNKKVKKASKKVNSRKQVHNKKILIKSQSFNTSSAIVLKAKYQGEKQISWLNFYTQPKDCFLPKTTQRFAYCMEDRQQQQIIFEQQYE